MFLDYVATGRGDLVEDYLERGGNPKVVNCKGETALHIAAAHHQNEILARLLPYFSETELDVRNMYGLPLHITAVKYGNEIGAELISNYYNTVKTKPYRFKNYSFKKSIKKEIPLANPIVYPSGIQNRLSEQNYLSVAQNLQGVLKGNKKLTKKKANNSLRNNDLNARVKKILNKYLKSTTVKSAVKSKPKTHKNHLREVENYESISNLPEELRYLPEGNYSKPLFEPHYNSKNTKAVIIKEKKPRSVKKPKSEKKPNSKGILDGSINVYL